VVALGAVAVAVAAGLAVRRWTGGEFAKDAGVAWYAAGVYGVVVYLAPRARPVVAGAVALAVCWAIEFAQLSPVPAALSAHGTLVRLVLGTTFHAPDLFWYAVGTAGYLGLDAARYLIAKSLSDP
jgi:hypothetical protein